MGVVQPIRKTFAERVRRSSILSQLIRDLERVSGIHIQFFPVEEEESFPPPCYAHSPLCRTLNERAAGTRLCSRAKGRFLEQAREGFLMDRCVAGTVFCAVPVPSSLGLLGHLVVAGFYSSPLTLPEVNRVRHLLEREGLRLPPTDVMRLGEKTRIVEPQRVESLRRLLEMAAGYLVKELSLELFLEGEDLPAPIRRACAYIREHFGEDPTQEEVAAIAGYSASHFSRVFHARTGLRFKEYVNEVRLQYVRRQLRETSESITTIAMAAGFRTISQFNRQFQLHYKLSPREYRKKYRNG